MKYDIAIVGAGFCGTLVALNAARLDPKATIALVDQSGEFGPGLAYGTPDPDHLLNVRASQMGAFADDAGHFWKWLENSEFGADYSIDSFVPRRIYGLYLKKLVADQQKQSANITLLSKRIENISKSANSFTLETDDADVLQTEKVVLALGNFPPDAFEQNGPRNPYDAKFWAELAEPKNILVVGTGLTSLDLVVTLARTKKSGAIHLLSRHGLLPREHTVTRLYKLVLDWGSASITPLRALQMMRQEIVLARNDDAPWQSVIDALRPYNQTLWKNFDRSQKKQFLRHLRVFWDVHRHRCAPEIMDAVRKLQTEKRLFIHAGYLKEVSKCGGVIKVTWRPRLGEGRRELDVEEVAYCTGPQSDFLKLKDKLVRNLLRNALIETDDVHMGIKTDDTYRVRSFAAPVDGLFAIGSILKGQLYESVAVPELRIQAKTVADQLANGGYESSTEGAVGLFTI